MNYSNHSNIPTWLEWLKSLKFGYNKLLVLICKTSKLRVSKKAFPHWLFKTKLEQQFFTERVQDITISKSVVNTGKRHNWLFM